MTTLVVGASGATGRLLVQQLLERGEPVRAIVRSPEHFLATQPDTRELTVIPASVLELTDAELAEHVAGCSAVASCLGHTLSFKGIFGPPRRLVTDAVRRLCEAVETHHHEGPTKFVLMNTTGNRNRDLDERISFSERCVIGLIRALVPPHADNEQAADFLRTRIGQTHPSLEWAAVRPDSLIDSPSVTAYDVHESPIRSAIFDAGKTSRIHVAHFMAQLITDDDTWQQWKGRMPVLYNSTPDTSSTISSTA